MNSQPRILFFGTPPFADVALQALIREKLGIVSLVITQPDRPSGRGQQLVPPPVKVTALKHNIPVLQPKSVRRELVTLTSEVSKYGPFDVGIVSAFGQILPTETFAWARAGLVNIHASLLPRWRGAAPIQRAIAAGDTSTGVCLMQIEEGLDTGGVFAQAETSIAASDTATTVHDRLAQLGVNLLRAHLVDIAEGKLLPTPQPSVGVTHAAKISAEEAAINWMQSAESIDRTTRAFDPAPGAFTYLGEKRLKVFRALPTTSGSSNRYAPGTIVRITDHLLVQTGDGLSRLEEVQLEGKKRMATKDLLRGLTVAEGSVLHSLPPTKTPTSQGA